MFFDCNRLCVVLDFWRVQVLPHIINAGVFTSAFSAGNSFLFCSSRILYGLALRGQAPKFLAYCTKKGLPLAAVLTSVSLCSSYPDTLAHQSQSSFVLLAFMNVTSGAATVFKYVPSNNDCISLILNKTFFPSWFVNLSTTAGFFGWFSINVTYIFFRELLLAVKPWIGC